MPKPQRINVLLSAGRKLLREGISSLLERYDDIKVVGECDDARATTRLAAALSVDVVILNVIPPFQGGPELIQGVLRARPDVRLIVLTLDPSPGFLANILAAGAKGCLSKECSGIELVQAIRKVMSGEVYLSQRLIEVVVTGYARPARKAGERSLAPREREILQRIARGETTKEIAAALRVSSKTIETHRRRLMQKLGKHTVAELTKYAVLEGLSPLDNPA